MYKLLAVRWGDDVGVVDMVTRRVLMRVSAKSIEVVHWQGMGYVTIKATDFDAYLGAGEVSEPTWDDVPHLVTHPKFTKPISPATSMKPYRKMGNVMLKALQVY